MAEQRFSCTACGLCCSGLVPLTISEAIAHSDRFPLAITMTPVKPGTRGQGIVERIGAPVMFAPKKKTWLLVTPVSFIPATIPCPALRPDNLCGIHAEKPIRCRTMPLYAYKDEDHQHDMLIPRSGWQCDTSAAAPVVYRDRAAVDQPDFYAERDALLDQAPELRRFAELFLKHSPVMLARVAKAAESNPAGKVIAGFVALLRYDRNHDIRSFAARQYPVLEDWQARTVANPKLADFNRFYSEALADLKRYIT